MTTKKDIIDDKYVEVRFKSLKLKLKTGLVYPSFYSKDPSDKKDETNEAYSFNTTNLNSMKISGAFSEEHQIYNIYTFICEVIEQFKVDIPFT